MKLAEACAEVEVYPVKTNAGFLARCLTERDFIRGEVDTGFIEARLDGPDRRWPTLRRGEGAGGQRVCGPSTRG